MLFFLSSLALAVPCGHKLLSALPPTKLTHLRNTIMARNGYTFSDAALQATFESKSWYKPGESNDIRYSDKDRRCLERLEMWERNTRLLFQGKANLGKGEEQVPIFLLSHRPNYSREARDQFKCIGECSLLLIVGNDDIKIPAYWLEGTDQGKVETRIVDIVSNDNAKEVWLVTTGPLESHYNRFINYKDGSLRLQELNGGYANSGDVILSDDGRVALDDQSCTQRTRTWYEFKEGEFAQLSQEKAKVSPRSGCGK
ncbi:MAG: YARHG domain-containing protein [Myxococcota bacterium]|nr:YARHG domain-containing protein [Myxococcota bacterium]